MFLLDQEVLMSHDVLLTSYWWGMCLGFVGEERGPSITHYYCSILSRFLPIQQIVHVTSSVMWTNFATEWSQPLFLYKTSTTTKREYMCILIPNIIKHSNYNKTYIKKIKYIIWCRWYKCYHKHKNSICP